MNPLVMAKKNTINTYFHINLENLKVICYGCSKILKLKMVEREKIWYNIDQANIVK